MRQLRHSIPVALFASIAATFSLMLIAGGCGVAAPATPPGAGTTLQAPEPETRSGDVLAVVGGEDVTLEDLQGIVGDQLDQMDFQYRSQRHQVIDSAMRRYVRDQLVEAEAEERGVTVDELVEEIVSEQEPVTEETVRAFYVQNQAQLQGRSYESIAPQIRQYLEDQQRQTALQEFADDVADEHGATYMLEPFRVDIDITGAPVTGPDDAPITLVEFSDFECPYCDRFLPTLKRVQEEYGDRLRLVFMHFPLRNLHPNAQKSAEASMCAFEQDKFWEAHDLFFAERESLRVDDLKEKAERLELDTEAFADCLDSGKYVDYIDEDVSTGIAVGVDGTPAIFVNGRPVPGGAVPFEAVAEVIEDELERVGR